VTGAGRFRGAGVLALGGPVVMLEMPNPVRLTEDDIQIAVQAAGVGNWDERARVGAAVQPFALAQLARARGARVLRPNRAGA
jgi:hypothetical protein